MEIIVKILQFFLCFTILVGIHELGHFLMARLFKIRVEKFYIFFNPWFSIAKWKRGETEYGIGWLPLGGYVTIAGMIDESMDTEQMKQPAKPDEFRSKPAWQRFLVMIAGVVMNIVLAVAIYIGICYTWGESYLANDNLKWGYNFNAAAEKMGFRDGDKIMTIDGEKLVKVDNLLNELLLSEEGREVVVERDGELVTLNIPLEQLIETRRNGGFQDFFALPQPFIIDSIAAVHLQGTLMAGDHVRGIDAIERGEYPELRSYIASRAGDSITLHVVRDGQLLDIAAPVSAKGTIGVMTNNYPYELTTEHYTLLESIPAGIRKAGRTVASYWEQLKMIVQPKTKMYEELGGFIAIGSIFSGEWMWHDFWLKTAFLSIILAVMNILPIPVLDGGHAIFTLWEMITGRKPSDKFLEVAQYIGLGLLFLLLLYANGNDVYRFFIR